jgi:riboflavin kinase/FMN adenylyltransferase
MQTLFTISGIVTRGKGDGKALGYPTANIPLQTTIPEGIYAATVMIDGKIYQAATFVGAAKTFQRTDSNIESSIFDFNSDIYGKQITVNLHKKLRENQIFLSIPALIRQIAKDVEEAREFFSLSEDRK